MTRVGLVMGFGLICESDSMEVIEIIKVADVKFHTYAWSINGIRNLLTRDWRVDITHELREGIQVADFLAKMGAKNGHPCSALEEPSGSFFIIF